MDKMIFGIDEERARKDGADPEAFYNEIESVITKYGGKYRKERSADGTVTYIGDDERYNWLEVFGCVHICGRHSEFLAKYCTKWLWDYDDEDSVEGDFCEEDLLEFNIRKCELFQRYYRG